MSDADGVAPTVGIAAVLFDLDETLCRREQSGAAVYEGAFDHAGVDPFGSPDDLWAALDGPPDSDDEVGYLADGFARVVARYDREDVDPVALARGFAAVVDHSQVSFVPGAETALAAAVAAGPVGLVTNGPERRQAVKLRALGLESTFDVVVYAGDLPNRKPHRDPFDRAVDVLGVEHGATLHVGDSLAYDVAGARNAGLLAAWYHGDGDPDPGDHAPEFLLPSLADLEAVLARRR